MGSADHFASPKDIADRLAGVRNLMRISRVDVLLVPSADPHLSEYLPGYWQGRRWLSGFQGSVGTLIVTLDFACLCADSRYWEQAERELAESSVKLLKLMPGGQGVLEWVAELAIAGSTVAVDGAVMAVAAARQLTQLLKAKNASLRTDLDLLSKIWTNRPALPLNPIYEHRPPYASATRAEKLNKVRKVMGEQGADTHLLATLDDIAWLFNLRGSDVQFNPVFLAFALIGKNYVSLYIAPEKIDPALHATLLAEGIELKAYTTISSDLAALPAKTALLVDPARVTCEFINSLPHSVKLVEQINPSTTFKSQKSELDAEFVRATMEQDGAALCEFFDWFERALCDGEITELDVDYQLLAARSRRPGFVSPSFATIAAFNANGAMPHYRATKQSHARIEGNGLLLIDSGGQYLGGTTDITRMVLVGELSDEQLVDCTRVLQGMIALSSARFPKGIHSPMLDGIARAPLWAHGLNYGHGTGHGVGYFLNVHEGPQSISYAAPCTPHTAMQQGMITSIEPGVYRPERWGVRIENLVINQLAEGSEFGEFLEFETLTLCPIDTRCFKHDLLTPNERQWLNAYHETVRTRLAPLLQGSSLQWLLERTQAI